MKQLSPRRALRAQAFAAFSETGRPHRRLEDWKYTDLRRLVRDVPPPAQDPGDAVGNGVGPFDGIERAVLVFVDGHFRAELSDFADLRDAVDVCFLGENPAALAGSLEWEGLLGAPIEQLNAAFVADGVMLTIRARERLPRPLEIRHVASGGAASAYVRHRLVFEPNCRATVFETFVEPAAVRSGAHINAVLDVEVGAGAEVRWVKTLAGGHDAVHLSTTRARLAAAASLEHFLFNETKGLSRNELVVRFDGEGARAALRGVALARGAAHHDITLRVDHAVPECESVERYKAVLDDRARGVFQGKITVRPHAQKTDARMMTQALLLSDDSAMANKPELEIWADDVQCAHGATNGEIDEDLLFYLRARGIPHDEARGLLILAFLAETVEELDNEQVVGALEAAVRAWLSREAASQGETAVDER